MRIRTLIVDDEPLARERVRLLLADEPDVEILGACANGPEAIDAIEAHRPDLVFLDIQMPEVSGFDVLRALPPDTWPLVIFVTAHDRHAIEAFEIRALDYLLKPFKRARFRLALARAREHLESRETAGLNARLRELLEPPPTEPTYLSRLAVKTGERTLFVKVEDIDFLESAAGYAAYFTQQGTKTPRYEFRTNVVTRGDLIQSVTANGQILPLTNVTVGSQISGQIKEVLVDFNMRVTNGQVLAKIDPSTYERDLQQSQADLANAQAGLNLAKVNNDRSQSLLSKKLIAPSDADQTAAALQQAQAMVTMREAAVERSRVDLGRTTIYSPVDGLVISRNVDVGQTVAASFNTPTLFQIVTDLSRMQIEAAVSEADVGGVEEGQRVTFLVDAFQGRTFEGKVRQVRYAPTTNQNVVTYTTVIDVRNDDLKLRPGMTANVSIVTAEKDGVLRVPNAALRFRPPEGTVAMVPTNAPMAGAGTNAPAGAAAAAKPAQAGEMPAPPWVAEGRTPTREERQKFFESLTPEQREQMRARMQARGGRGGGGSPGGFGEGGGGFGGGFGGPGGNNASRPQNDGPGTHTVCVLANPAEATGSSALLKAVTVKSGISDGVNTEILEGLKEGDVIATGLKVTTTVLTASPNSPFGGPMGGMRRPPR